MMNFEENFRNQYEIDIEISESLGRFISRVSAKGKELASNLMEQDAENLDAFLIKCNEEAVILARAVDHCSFIENDAIEEIVDAAAKAFHQSILRHFEDTRVDVVASYKASALSFCGAIADAEFPELGAEEKSLVFSYLVDTFVSALAIAQTSFLDDFLEQWKGQFRSFVEIEG